MLAGSLLLLSAVPAASQSAYYIRPGGTGDGTSPAKAFGSIEQARDALRARSDASITGDITVNLLPGTYFLAAPLTFHNRDSGRNGHIVVYQSQQPARPAVISGGVRLTGAWERGENGIWHTQAPPGIFAQARLSHPVQDSSERPLRLLPALFEQIRAESLFAPDPLARLLETARRERVGRLYVKSPDTGTPAALSGYLAGLADDGSIR